jgi:hypothetical protein
MIEIMVAFKIYLFAYSRYLLTVFGIKCYVCNSGYKYAGDDCLDIPKLKAGDYLKDCADEEVKDRIENGTYKYCRMFGQTGL